MKISNLLISLPLILTLMSPAVAKPQNYTKLETVAQYEWFLRAAAKNGLTGLSASYAATEALKAAGFKTELLTNEDRKNVRIAVFGK